MKVSYASNLEQGSGLWVLPFWEGPKGAAEFSLVDLEGPLFDFKGKNGEAALCYLGGQRILLIGLGAQDKASVEALRKAYSAVVRTAQAKKVKKIDLLFPKCKQRRAFLQGIVEGLLLTNYSFTYKHDVLNEDPVVLLEQVSFVGIERNDLSDKLQKIIEGVYFVRDLVNANADDKIDLFLKAAKKAHPKIKTVIFDKKRLEAEKMGLILAVNRASSLDPYLVQVSYKGCPKSDEQVVLVGKGITYDTGGLSIKPTDGMLDMKCDMAGAATVLSAVRIAAVLGLKVNVTALMPLTENCIGSKSYKLGDVYRAYSGKTIEINNTDAEGRLVLADAIAYAAQNLKPGCIIDVATLTGSCVVALGDGISGLFSNDDGLAEQLAESSERTDELIWRFPMHSDYKESLKSEIADMKNSGGREAGAIKAALFLQEFAGTVPWAHLDIAGPAFIPKPKDYNPVRGTGHGLRLLVDFLEGRSS
ncbi:MAG: leucyl aminopeptidase [Chlamydiales bacterium]